MTSVPIVINDHLFDPDRCQIYTPNEGTTGIAKGSAGLLARLAAEPGRTLTVAELGRLLPPESSAGAPSVVASIDELNRILGSLPNGEPCIHSDQELGCTLNSLATTGQPPPDSPRYREKPLYRRPAAIGALIAVILALASLMLVVSTS